MKTDFEPLRIPGSRRRALLGLITAFGSSAFAPLAMAATTALNGHVFTIPDGFTLELAAGNQLAPRPVSGSFDDQGRLYVTDSSGSNKPPSEQLKDPQSRILRLEDRDRDGRFETTSVFADKVMFPQGCLWHDGSVYVAGPPSIWKFTDTDGDGRADQRTEWYQGHILTGCANDVHGPYLGPEGMIYWTKGAFGTLNLKDGKGRALTDRCAHIFRARPDGSGLESVMSGGMDNPVEIAFTPSGEPIFTSTFIDLSQPGRRDGLGHAVFGGVFGKVHDVVDDAVVQRTGDLMPAMTQFGPAAVCAITRYTGNAFGPDHRDNLFVSHFNLRKVSRHVLNPSGATFTTVDSDFVVSDQTDFHPTEVMEDADGSLLIFDTGGWYKLCCPSSQLAKADVLGAIYRVRRGPSRSPDTRPDASSYTRLTLPPPTDAASPVASLKMKAIKANPDSLPEFLAALDTHTARSGTSTTSAHLARVAAEGIGRVGSRAGVLPLYDAIAKVSKLSTPSDRFLEHSLLYALIQTGDMEAASAQLSSEDLAIRRAAIFVLEQSGSESRLEPDLIAEILGTSQGPLQETAVWVAHRHPEWGGPLTARFKARLSNAIVPATEKAAWEGLLGLLTRHVEGQAFLAAAATSADFRTQTRIAALGAMASAGFKQTPSPWRDAVLRNLDANLDASANPSTHLEILAATLRSAQTLPFQKSDVESLATKLHAIASNGSLDRALRIEAISGLPSGSALQNAEFVVLLETLQPESPAPARLAAASAVQRARLSPEQFRLLTPTLATAGPIELPRLVAAYAATDDPTIGKALVSALQASKILRALRLEDVRSAVARFPDTIQSEITRVVTLAHGDTSQDRVRLDALLDELKKLPGDIRRGQSIFNSPKAACASCHRLGYLGGNLGPDLTSIGTSRAERDLLEAVVFPSSSFVRSYEPWIATTKDGNDLSGVLRRDTPSEVVLATGPGAEVRIARTDLLELRLGNLSVMPAGLDEQLTRQELSDLIAFLKNTKWGVN